MMVGPNAYLSLGGEGCEFFLGFLLLVPEVPSAHTLAAAVLGIHNCFCYLWLRSCG